MFIKIISRIIVLAIALILLIFIFRNPIIKLYFNGYAAKAVKGTCKIDKVNLWFDNLDISGLKLHGKDLDINAENITIRFKFQRQKPVCYVSDIKFSGVTFRLNVSESVTDNSKEKIFPFYALATVNPIKMSLENIIIDFKSKQFELNSNFSIILESGPGEIYLRDAYIDNFSIHSQDFEITDLSFKKLKNNKYLLKIPAVRIKDKAFDNFLIPIKSDKNQLIFPKAKNAFFGTDGFVSAKVDFKGYESMCAFIKFKDVSFEKIVDIFAPEDAAFKGLFDGDLDACLGWSGIQRIEANFKNKGNGFINIKKESSFAFLKSYLDTPSYHALIDNFKNYEYNIGSISAKKDKEALGINFNFNFTSEKMGQRDISINFHDILGGAK